MNYMNAHEALTDRSTSPDDILEIVPDVMVGVVDWEVGPVSGKTTTK